jgi:isoaspartyl peptidase/L-asparaginase-like protein (Ntn-hydrolase superfamily)
VLDREGHMAMPFSTQGMFRAYVTPDGETAVRIFDQADGE